MEYKKLADDLLSGCEENCANCEYAGDSEFECTIAQLASTAITDLLVENQALRNAANKFKAQAEKAEKKLAAVGTIYALIADCPPETCREICANHDGVCAKHAEAGHYDHCKEFKWIGVKEE